MMNNAEVDDQPLIFLRAATAVRLLLPKIYTTSTQRFFWICLAQISMRPRKEGMHERTDEALLWKVRRADGRQNY